VQFPTGGTVREQKENPFAEMVKFHYRQ